MTSWLPRRRGSRSSRLSEPMRYRGWRSCARTSRQTTVWAGREGAAVRRSVPGQARRLPAALGEARVGTVGLRARVPQRVGLGCLREAARALRRLSQPGVHTWPMMSFGIICRVGSSLGSTRCCVTTRAGSSRSTSTVRAGARTPSRCERRRRARGACRGRALALRRRRARVGLLLRAGRGCAGPEARLGALDGRDGSPTCDRSWAPTTGFSRARTYYRTGASGT